MGCCGKAQGLFDRARQAESVAALLARARGASTGVLPASGTKRLGRARPPLAIDPGVAQALSVAGFEFVCPPSGCRVYDAPNGNWLNTFPPGARLGLAPSPIPANVLNSLVMPWGQRWSFVVWKDAPPNAPAYGGWVDLSKLPPPEGAATGLLLDANAGPASVLVNEDPIPSGDLGPPPPEDKAATRMRARLTDVQARVAAGEAEVTRGVTLNRRRQIADSFRAEAASIATAKAMGPNPQSVDADTVAIAVLRSAADRILASTPYKGRLGRSSSGQARCSAECNLFYPYAPTGRGVYPNSPITLMPGTIVTTYQRQGEYTRVHLASTGIGFDRDGWIATRELTPFGGAGGELIETSPDGPYTELIREESVAMQQAEQTIAMAQAEANRGVTLNERRAIADRLRQAAAPTRFASVAERLRAGADAIIASTPYISRLGRSRRPPGTAPVDQPTSAAMFAQLQDAISKGRSPLIIASLRQRFEALQREEAAAGTGQIKRLGRVHLPPGTAAPALTPSGLRAQIRDAQQRGRSSLIVQQLIDQFDGLPVLFTARVSGGVGGTGGGLLESAPTPAIDACDFTRPDRCYPAPALEIGTPVYVLEAGIASVPATGFPYPSRPPREWWLVRTAFGDGYVQAVNFDGSSNFTTTNIGASGEIQLPTFSRRRVVGYPDVEPSTGLVSRSVWR